MDIELTLESAALTRMASLRSRHTAAPVAAFQVDDEPPGFFVENEVLVDAREPDLVEELVRRGGTVVPEPDLPPPSPDGPERRREPDMDAAPRDVVVRFDRPPEGAAGDLGALLDRTESVEGDRLTFTSELGEQVAAAIAPMCADGRSLGLNSVGEPFTLPLSSPVEGPGMTYSSDPLTWSELAGRTRIVEAWQLVESVKIMRGDGAPVWVCICDQGFWLDPSGQPGGQPASDFGPGVLRWNLADENAPVPGGGVGGSSSFHGNAVASAAAAAVGNRLGAAGSGGTVVRPAFFHCTHTAAQAKRAVRLCVWWGLDVINFSWGFWGQSELWFGTTSWNDTFSWGADNGLVSVAAGGNLSWHLPDDMNVRPATRTPRSLTVGALRDDNSARPSSSWGSSVGLWAPGESVPVAPDGDTPRGSMPSGTSFAAPLVAGVAAMMRFCSPNMSADEVRGTLVETGWAGDGRVTRGLDAYAAVLAALGHSLPDPTDASGVPRDAQPLVRNADGSLTPSGGRAAIARRGDVDTYVFDVTSLSTVTLRAEWYQRLARLDVRIEATDDRTDPQVATTGGPTTGQTVLTGVLAPGKYRVRISGNGPTAYRLSVTFAPVRLAPDRFEPNDTFETAAMIRVVAPAGPFVTHLDLATWGPGGYDATLHTAGSGTGTTDQDFYRLEVPADVGALRIPQLQINDSDEPVDVTLFDAARTVLRSWQRVRDLVIGLPAGATSIVRVSGPTHTRYGLFVGALLDADRLRKEWQEELRIIPDWWEDPHPDWVVRPEEHFGVVIGPEMLDDGVLVLGTPEGGQPVDDLRLALLDDAGTVVREATVADGRQVIDVSGLAEGAFVLRATVSAPRITAPVGLLALPPR